MIELFLWIVIGIIVIATIFFNVRPMFLRQKTWVENSDARGQSILMIESLGEVKQGRVLSGIDIGDNCILKVDFHGNVEELTDLNPFYIKPRNPFQVVCGSDPPLFIYDERTLTKEIELKREIYKKINYEKIEDKELKKNLDEILTLTIHKILSQEELIDEQRIKDKRQTDLIHDQDIKIRRLEDEVRNIKKDMKEFTTDILEATRPKIPTRRMG